ncbi:ATP-binding protein [Lutimonas saemankumensis]|uniref:AAA family ATPase n=1 Tax=Lutimonas saemankumensis TaxID=483016 RepID=UPI001CD52D09|nr:AAA family ATPase [Lutimonas saemankumensis]MCA0933250.1 ATP-binding protein [Lutimonas saemankumensis]
MKLQKAQKEQIKLRIGLSGASGFGKSYSALLLAYGITNNWNKIAVIDTENGSINLYSELGDFSTISLSQPYSPERYIQAIKACENAKMEVIIIDSITHEWNGRGGCLQIHENLGGRFQDWAKVTPRHQAFIDCILQSSCHIITTVRRKSEFSLDQDANGRMKVVKLGTKEQTREGFEYELTINFELINDNHLCIASKDRTGLFMNKPEFVISSGTGKILKQWCQKGITNDFTMDIEKEISQCSTLEGLRHIYIKYPNKQGVIREKLIQRKRELEEAKSTYLDNKEIINNIKTSENGTTRNDY